MTRKSKATVFLVSSIITFLTLELIASAFYFQIKGNHNLALVELAFGIRDRWFSNATENELPTRYIRLREHRRSMHKVYGIPDDSTHKWPQDKFLLRTDSMGFVLPSFKHHNPDHAIVFLGGSTTECLYMAEADRFPNLSGMLLEEATGYSVNSINSGVSGNNLMHSIDLLINKIIPLNPDYVIIMHNINDLATLMYEHTYWNQHPTRSLIFDPSIQNKSPNNKWTHQTKPIGEFEKLPQISNEFRKALLTFIAICKSHGIKPVLMSQANQLLYDNQEKFNYLPEEFWGENFMTNYHSVVRSYQHFNKIICEIAKEEEVLFIDLAAEIPQNSQYFYDPVHLNHNGSKLAADLISKVIHDSWRKGEDR